MGIQIGMIPLVNAKVITEVEAFRILFSLDAVPVGGGGVNGSEGSVVLVAEGGKEDLNRAIRLIESIKGEPPLRPKKSLCNSCFPVIPSMLASPDKPASKRQVKHCMYQGSEEQELPPHLRQRASRK
jgi:hypothetical protein